MIMQLYIISIKKSRKLGWRDKIGYGISLAILPYASYHGAFQRKSGLGADRKTLETWNFVISFVSFLPAANSSK